jgi:hypothetical protein
VYLAGSGWREKINIPLISHGILLENIFELIRKIANSGRGESEKDKSGK